MKIFKFEDYIKSENPEPGAGGSGKLADHAESGQQTVAEGRVEVDPLSAAILPSVVEPAAATDGAEATHLRALGVVHWRLRVVVGLVPVEDRVVEPERDALLRARRRLP